MVKQHLLSQTFLWANLRCRFVGTAENDEMLSGELAVPQFFMISAAEPFSPSKIIPMHREFTAFGMPLYDKVDSFADFESCCWRSL
jgi:hypothetical protein